MRRVILFWLAVSAGAAQAEVPFERLVNAAGERQRTRLSKLMSQPFRWKGAGT